MPPTGKYRLTIREMLLAIAAFAVALALPRLMNSPDRLIVSAIVAVLTVLLAINAAIEIAFGKLCPACSRRALRRLARHRNYYRCLACRAQLKRFGFGPWLDASGPDDARRYGRRSEAGIWKSFDVPEDLDGSSAGLLLGRKRAGDLIGELEHHPHDADAGRRLEEARRKVRAFLKRRWDEIEE